MFDEKTQQSLKYYVYLLINPVTKKPFYIWKWIGNRVFNHVKCALETETINDKYEEIKSIQKEWKKVEHVIVRHGLSEKEAYEIEGTLIDTLSYLQSGLTNIMGGHNCVEKWLMTSDEIIRLYNAEKLNSISPDCIVININKQYKRGFGEEWIYLATKETWSIDKKKIPNIRYVLSEYKGLIVEVFEVEKWYPKERGYNPWAKKFGDKKIGFGFDWKIAPAEIRKKYINKSIAHKKTKWMASVIRYSI